MGMLYWYVGNLTPDAVVALRQKKTDQALIQARDALLGYALRYREVQAAKDLNSTEDDDRAMYGYLPLPDMGSSRNNNTEIGLCKILPNTQLEGCDANYANITYDSNGMPPTLIGRFPWRTLGTGVLRDGENECLWLVISSSHGRIQRTSPPATPPAMNWDTLGQLEVVTATNAASLQSQLTSKHDRPIAVIFSPGPRIGNQDRAPSTTDDISQCGGNYDAQNYLESLVTTLDTGLASQRTTTSNLFSGAINNASGDTSPDPSNSNPALRDKSKPLSISGNINNQSGNLTKAPCTDCTLVANDRGLSLTSAQFFDKLRAGTAFRTDIHDMLTRMVGCLSDSIAGGSGFSPVDMGYPSLTDKTVGRIPEDVCYNDDKDPKGYFSNYKDQIFVAQAKTGYSFSVNGTSNCAGVLIFAGQRGIKNPVPTDNGESRIQMRHSDAVSATNTRTNTDWLTNYLEGTNLASFTAIGTTFSGAETFGKSTAALSSATDSERCTHDLAGNVVPWRVKDTDCQIASQDVVRCIPTSATLSSDVVSPTLNAYGGQLTSYDSDTRTLSLGRVLTSVPPSSAAGALFGCTWAPKAELLGNGLRSYFKFRIIDAGEGFTFAIVDGDRNGTNVCGEAYQHLGYSGNNGVTPIVAPPKIGIEFDTARQSTFTPANSPLNNGRDDPSYAGQHFGIVYWGGETQIATGQSNATCTNALNATSHTWSSGACYLKAEEDDNAHGRPVPPDTSTRPSPRNPVAPASPTLGAGVYKLDPGNSQIPVGVDFHVRIEITRTATNSTLKSKTYSVNAWLLKDSVTDANIIASMRNTTRAMGVLYPGYPAHVSDNPVIYDIQGASCSVSSPCPTGDTCGSDGKCYAEVFRTARIGFTTAQRATSGGNQSITINDLFTTWLP